MDQHPIPQDVTGFQFKLIGTMTVKQFGYVATGVISAVILFYGIPNTGFMAIIKWLLIPVCAGSGFIISFVPIEGRPIDVMTSNFVKALLSPNQYAYHKEARLFSFSTISLKPVQAVNIPANQAIKPDSQQLSGKEQQLQNLLLRSQSQPKNLLDQKERAFLDKFTSSSYASISAPASTAIPATPVPPSSPAPILPKLQSSPSLPSPQSTSPAPELLSKKEELLEQQLDQAKHAEAQVNAPTAHQKVLELEKQIQEIHLQKQQIEQELSNLKNTLSVQQQPITTPPQTIAPVVVQEHPKPVVPPVLPQKQSYSPNVRNIPQGMNKSAGLPQVSDTPNVVIGIVKDSRGNVLPNILIEVKDAEGNPVRAFKTNVLGQFASATPLPNGIYTIELEDPKKQHTFDTIRITPDGQIMLPIEVFSHDAREELRKQLFN